MPANTQPSSGLAVSPQQRQFLTGFTKATGLDPNVSAAWLRNEEPAISQNTDPAGHGRYNFLNVGITDNKSYAAQNPAWTNPLQAGVTTGNWLAGRLALPGYGKSAASVQAILKSVGAPAQQQIQAIQGSGWASGGETALPGLYQQALGTGGAAPAATGTAPQTTLSSAPPQRTMNLAPLQASLALGQQQAQKAQDALGALSGNSVTVAKAPTLAALTTSAQPNLQPTSATAQHVTVNLKDPIPSHVGTQAQKVIELAKHYLGTKYVYGGASPKTGFDCSGLIQYIEGLNGTKLPRTAAEQSQVGQNVAPNQLQPGDRLYFQTEGAAAGVTHTALYVGDGQLIEAPHTGDVIKVAPLAGYYQQHLVGAKRGG